MSNLVCLRTFPTREAAVVAGNVLREHGIESAVSAHDGGDGGYDFAFASIGAELLVGEDIAEVPGKSWQALSRRRRMRR